MILEEFYTLGITRVALLMGDGMKHHVQTLPITSKLEIMLVDPQKEIKTTLIQSGFFRNPFLFQTTHHYEKAIITELLSTSLQGFDACVVIDSSDVLPKNQSNGWKITGLSSTSTTTSTTTSFTVNNNPLYTNNKTATAANAKKHEFDLAKTSSLDDVYTGIGIGTSVFLEEMVSRFTEGKKAFVDTIIGETLSQLAKNQRLGTIDLASKNSQQLPFMTPTTTATTSLTTEENSTQILDEANPMFQSFLVGTNDTDSSRTASFTHITSVVSSDGNKGRHLSMILNLDDKRDRNDLPLLSFNQDQSSDVFQALQARKESFSDIETGVISTTSLENQRLLVSIPLDTVPTAEPSSSHSHAYLIGINEQIEPQFVLAVPQIEKEMEDKLFPSDIEEVTLDTVVKDDNNIGIQVIVRRKVPLIGFILLCCSVLASSSQGAVLQLQDGVAPMTKFLWRATGSSIAFFPFALYSMWKKGIRMPSKTLVASLLFCSCAWSYNNCAMQYAMTRTTVGHAYIFGSTQSLMIVLGKIVLRYPVLALEFVGTLIGISGIVLTTQDSSTQSTVSASLVGDMIALSAAVGSALYVIRVHYVRKHFDLPVLMWLMSTFASILVFTASNAMGTKISFSFHKDHGIFGWMNWDIDRLPIALYVVFIGSFVGTTGSVVALRYFEPLIVSVASLTNPVFANMFAVLLGVDVIPGMLTFVGAFLVLLGTVGVVCSAKKKTESIDATAALTKLKKET